MMRLNHQDGKVHMTDAGEDKEAPNGLAGVYIY
jgi:hypothetical protein